jgi:hypothetical protein
LGVAYWDAVLDIMYRPRGSRGFPPVAPRDLRALAQTKSTKAKPTAVVDICLKNEHIDRIAKSINFRMLLF